MNSSEDFIYGPNDYGELNGSCQRCHVHYGSAAELKLHFATIHQRQTFECFVCNKLFLQKFNFLAHIDRVHPDLGKNFSCQYCDRVSNFTNLIYVIYKEYNHILIFKMPGICIPNYLFSL